jgi:hypothetical protein
MFIQRIGGSTMRDVRRSKFGSVWRPFGLAIAITAVIAMIGCSDDKNPAKPGGGGGPTTSGFTGFMANGALSGKIVVTVNSTALAGRLPGSRAGAHDITASATFTFDGATMMISGTYDDEADTLNLAGSGYTFHGMLEAGGDTPAIVGEFDGPSGGGLFAVVTNALAPDVYCGNWRNAAMDDSGTFNVVANDTLFAGFAVAAVNPEPFDFLGTISGTGTTRTMNGTGGEPGQTELTITGTLNTMTSMASGTWDFTVSDPMYGTDDNGTWEMELCP